jgi:hypothetical protein
VPQAQAKRLQEALTEYITAMGGDGRGHSTRQVKGGANVKLAKQLLDDMGGSQDVRQDTPGARAVAQAREGASTPNLPEPAAQAGRE